VPKWVNWRARDMDGAVWWYEFEPIKYSTHWDRHRGHRGRREKAGPIIGSWVNSLEARP
jgi:hypothetical protein